MAQQTINIGASPNDGTGTPLRTAFQYTNSNFSELYTAVGPSGNNIVVPGNATISGDLTVDSGTLRVNSSNDRVGVGTNSPTSKLHVFGAGTNTSLTISDVGANYNIVLGTQSADIAQLAVFNTTIASGSKDFWLTALSHTFNTWNGSAYSNRFVIASDGVATWSNVGGVAGTAMTLNSTGLGVGVSPGTKFDVGLTGAGTPRIRFTSASDNPILEFQRYSGVASDYYGERILTGGGFYFQTAPAAAVGSQTFTTRFTIDSSGNVGVGVTPSAWGTYKGLQVGYASLAGYAGSDTLLGSNVYFDGGAFRYISTATASNYRQLSGVHQWNIAPSGTAGNAITFTQAMTLDASGNLLVGTTNTNPAYNAVNGIAVSPTFLSVSNTTGVAGAFNRNNDGIVLYFTRNGTAVGNVSVTTGGTTFNSTSDYRLKESISPLVGGLARVNALKPSIYKWKSDGSSGEGFLAHELAEVVPLAVTGQKDAVKDDGSIEAQGVDLSRVVPILVAAIQELAAEVNALKNA